METAPLGHGPLWLGYLVRALLPCVERITISHPDTPAYRELDALRDDRLQKRRLPWARGRDSWRGMFHAARDTGADLTLVTYLDPMVKRPLADDPRHLAGSPLWGLWFCPPERTPVAAWHPRFVVSRSYRSRWRQQQVLNNPPQWLSGAWFSDPLLMARVASRPGLQLHVLPDPWPTQPSMDRTEARTLLGLPQQARIFLHLGVADERKGLADAVLAWQALRDLPDAVLVRAGVVTTQQAAALAPLVQSGRAILHDGWVPAERLDAYLCACDWVLMPYRQHAGSSSLLAGAATVARPVITSDYGVLGQRVAESQLGLVYPHLSVAGLVDAVRRAASLDGSAYAKGLRHHGENHRVDDFIAALRQPLGLSSQGIATWHTDSDFPESPRAMTDQ